MTLRLVVPVILLTAIAIMCPSAAHAQRLSLFTSSMYDDNSFAFYEKRADVYHSLFGALSLDTQSDHTYVQFYYYGAVVLFRTFADRTYNVHTLGAYTQMQLDYRAGDEEVEASEETEASDETEAPEETGVDPSADDEAQQTEAAAPVVFSDSLVSYLFVIPQVGGRFDHKAWDFYDFQRASLLLRLRLHLFAGIMVRPHHTVQYKRYPNLEQFTHLENLAGVYFSRALGSGWELFVAADAGHKSYTEVFGDTLWVTDGKPGKGKGGVKPPVPVVSQFATPSTMQFVISGGVVWDLLPSAELSLSLLRRSNPSNDARFVNEGAIFGTTEDEIFDDVYGYQSSELRLHFEGMLPGGIRTVNMLRLADKGYPRTATNLLGVPVAGNPQRRDRRLQLQLQALYPLLRADDGTGLSIGLQYGYTRNQSNNAYHDFHVHQAAILLSGDW